MADKKPRRAEATNGLMNTMTLMADGRDHTPCGVGEDAMKPRRAP